MRSLGIGTAIILGSCLMLAVPADAGGSRGVQYAVAFSCGTTDGSAGAAPGDYFTSVGVLNGGTSDVKVRARVTLTGSHQETSDWVRTTIPAGRARELDCEDIFGGTFTFPTPLPADCFLEGFLVIQAESPLQVAARYGTSRADAVSSQVLPVSGTTVEMHRHGKDEEDVCHIPPGNPDNAHTITISSSAVSAHLRHGDQRGPCPRDDSGYDD